MTEYHHPRDSYLRSALKTVSWRIVGSIDTFFLSWFLTGNFKVAASIGSAEIVTKTILYYFHERLWAMVDDVHRWFRCRKVNK